MVARRTVGLELVVKEEEALRVRTPVPSLVYPLMSIVEALLNVIVSALVRLPLNVSVVALPLITSLFVSVPSTLKVAVPVPTVMVPLLVKLYVALPPAILFSVNVGEFPSGTVVPAAIVSAVVAPLLTLRPITTWVKVTPDASTEVVVCAAPSIVSTFTSGNVEAELITKLPLTLKLGSDPVLNVAPELFVRLPKPLPPLPA